MKQSAGILLYRKTNTEAEFFLVHPGGPFWKNKDLGAWSIPKGEFTDDENPLDAAIREFREETGTLLNGDFIKLEPIKQKSGKMVYAFAIQGNIDAADIISNTLEIEWPPKSGRTIEIPEVDKGGWFSLQSALEKINPAQQPLLNEALRLLL